MLSRIASLIRKELLAILRDPKGRSVLIFPPLFQLIIFSLAATMEVTNVDLAVLDHDAGRMGYELTERFRGSSVFDRVFALSGEAEIAPAVNEQAALAVLVIPQSFSRDLAAGRPTSVQLILDGRKTNSSLIIQGYASRMVEQFMEDEANLPPLPVQVVSRSWFNPNLSYRWYTVPSLVCILSMVIGLLVTSLSVARERETGTFDQLLVSPLRPSEILIGKASAALLIALAEGSLIFLAAVLVFGVPFVGSLALLYVGMTVFLISIIGVGLFISSLCTTQQQAILGAFMYMSPAVTLSGYASPIANMPEWLQPITMASSPRWFLVIVRGVFLKDMPASEVLANTWPMAVIAVVTLAAAAWLFRHRME